MYTGKFVPLLGSIEALRCVTVFVVVADFVPGSYYIEFRGKNSFSSIHSQSNESHCSVAFDNMFNGNI